jgi:hypothetical protein
VELRSELMDVQASAATESQSFKREVLHLSSQLQGVREESEGRRLQMAEVRA